MIADDEERARISAAVAPLRPHLSRTVVATDFDGVLAPIVPRPEDARALPGTAEVLAALAGRVARLAVVTGRPAGDVVSFGGFDDVPGLVVLGHYGLERWEDGRLQSPATHAGVDRARVRAHELAAGRPGVSVEDKGHSVALHTRRAPDPAGALAELTPLVAAVADETSLQVTPGRFVLELRPPGVDKGMAVRTLVDEASASAVVYAGDDLGDLPAVAAVRELGADGVTGFVVCADADETPAELRDQADLVVAGPHGVLMAFEALVEDHGPS